MRTIDLDTWPRRRHFYTFNAFEFPHFGLCAEVDITALYAAVKQQGASINLALVYAAARAANAIPEFRCRIRRLPGKPAAGVPLVQVVEHAAVHPSFTVLADEAVGGPALAGLPGAAPANDRPLPGALPTAGELPSSDPLPGAGSLFGFCAVDYQPHFAAFAAQAKTAMQAVSANPTLEDQPGRDDLLFMTAIPWVAFTGLLHPIHTHPADSVPRIAWGKFTRRGERLHMPLSVQAHHALLDGLHLGRYYEAIQTLYDRAPEWLS